MLIAKECTNYIGVKEWKVFNTNTMKFENFFGKYKTKFSCESAIETYKESWIKSKGR